MAEGAPWNRGTPRNGDDVAVLDAKKDDLSIDVKSAMAIDDVPQEVQREQGVANPVMKVTGGRRSGHGTARG